MPTAKRKSWENRKIRVRKNISGSVDRPRLSVYRSLKHIHAQIVDDVSGKTLLGLSTSSKSFSEKKATGNVQGAKQLGRMVAEQALAKKIDKVVFDRGGFLYHGRIQAFAEGAREAGLKF